MLLHLILLMLDRVLEEKLVVAMVTQYNVAMTAPATILPSSSILGVFVSDTANSVFAVTSSYTVKWLVVCGETN